MGSSARSSRFVSYPIASSSMRTRPGLSTRRSHAPARISRPASTVTTRSTATTSSASWPTCSPRASRPTARSPRSTCCCACVTWSEPRPSTTTASGSTPGRGPSTCRRPVTSPRSGPTSPPQVRWVTPLSRASRTLHTRSPRPAAASRGRGGTTEATNDIDADGYWTIDDYSALMGLASYRWLAQRLGDTAEYNWATDEYSSLLDAVNQTLAHTISTYGLDYLPCSMVEPNDDNRCANPKDANWAAPFLFGRWAWDGYLFDAPISGPGYDLIDATYNYGFGRLQGILPANTYGGYGTTDYSTGYNAGYGEWGLASNQHRDQGILGYQFMIANTQ